MSQHSQIERSRAEMAHRLLKQNRLDEALCIYEELCKPGQQDIDLWLNLALVYRKSGNFEQARLACEQALLLRDDYALAHHMYGSVQQCLGQMDNAIGSYRRALDLDPALTEAHYFLGNAMQMTGNPEQAVTSYQSAIELKPDYLEALSNLGAVLINLHRFDDALAPLQRASRLCPECGQVLCNLADLALRRTDFDEAESLARSALNVNPGFFDAHLLLGKIYRKREDFDRVLEHYNNARSLRPDNEDVLGKIAEILEMRGEFAAARELLEPLIEKGSNNPVVLRVFSALSRHFKDEERAIGLLENALQRGGLNLFQRIKLHSELGKQYDWLEEFPQAFSHYRRANELEFRLNVDVRKKSKLGFPGRRLIDKWYRRFDADYWRQLAHSGVSSKRPVFIVGLPRSGTTLAEQILASHPDVHGAGELQDIPEIVQQFEEYRSGKGFMALLEQLSVRQLAAAAEKYLAASGALAGDALRVVDKLPMNFWHLGMISLLFPGAHVINMQRDPRDVCLSIYFQRFDASMSFSTNLEELAEYYMTYKRVMEYWHTVLDIEILDVRYEDLVADQENVTRKMIGFCGLEWDERCLDFYKSNRDIHTPSYDQVRLPMYNKSVGRWKHYRQELQPLITVLDQDQ